MSQPYLQNQHTLLKKSFSKLFLALLVSDLSQVIHLSSSNEASAGSTTFDKLLASCSKSIAYIVGTHKDLVSEQQIDEFDKKLQHCIKSTDFYEEGVVQFSSEERMVLPVDNMNGGGAEIDKVRKFLEDGLKEAFQKAFHPCLLVCA